MAVSFGLAPHPAAAETVTIATLGDSLTAGFGLADEDAFPARLETALQEAGIAARVVNGGVSGDTTAGGLARLDWVLADDPDLVIVELGANDGLRGLDPAKTFDNLDAILTRLREEDIVAVLAGMFAPPNLGSEYSKAFNGVFPELADRHNVEFYPFFLEGVAAQPSLNQSDGMHPNAAGVEVIVAGILPHIRVALEQLDGS